MTRTLPVALTLPLTALLSLACVAGTTSPASSLPATGVPATAEVLGGSVEVVLSGTLVVSVVESQPGARGTARPDRPGRGYSVRTADGASVAVTGADLDGARTGDTFDGVVRVPGRVVDGIAGSTGESLEDAGSFATPSAGTDESAAILDAAAAAGEPLHVVNATLTVGPSALAEVPRNHVADIVVLNPADVAPLGGTYTDDELRWITLGATRHWEAQSRALGEYRIASFDPSTIVVRHPDEGTCEQSLDSIWDTAAQQLGYGDALAYLEASLGDGPVRHLVVYLPPGCGDVEPITAATFGASVNAGGLVMVTLGVDPDLSSLWFAPRSSRIDGPRLAHELGHNLSLVHSNLDFCTRDAVVTGCTQYEGADLADAMGWAVPAERLAPMNSAAELGLGWSDPSGTSRLALADGELRRIWSSWLHPLGQRLDTSDAPDIIAVVDPMTGEEYTIEFRTGGSQTFNEEGHIAELDAAGQDLVNYDRGVRLLRHTADGGTSVLTVPAYTSDFDFNQSSAWCGGWQDPVISNPSRSVVVEASCGGGTDELVTVTLSRPDTANAVPVFRFWSPAYRSHFYTSSVAERDKVIAKYPSTIWRYEGARFSAYNAPKAGTVPLFRFWSPLYRGHFCTIDAAERDRVIRNYPDTTWRYEGVAFHVFPLDAEEPNTVTVARFWSPLYRHHFYTADPLERDSVLRKYSSTVWRYEFDGFRVPKG